MKIKVEAVFLGTEFQRDCEELEFKSGYGPYIFLIGERTFEYVRGKIFFSHHYGEYMMIKDIVVTLDFEYDSNGDADSNLREFKITDIGETLEGAEAKTVLSTLACDRKYDKYAERIMRYDINSLFGEQTSRLGKKIEKSATALASAGGEKEKRGGDTMFKGLKFGVYEGDNVKATLMGMAVKGHDGGFISVKDGETMDSTMFSGTQMADVIMLPIPIEDIKEEDIILHEGSPCKVEAKFDKDRLSVVDIGKAEEKTILPVKSPLGFNFCTQLVSIFDMIDIDIDGGDNKSTLLMLAMMGNSNGLMGEGEGSDMNAMLPLMLMGDGLGGDSDMIKMMAMMQASSGGNMDMNSMLPMMLLMK